MNGERGVTTVDPGVFEKIAARAATEVQGVEGAVHGGLDRLLHPWTTPSSDASADVTEDGVAFDLVVNIVYPAPVRQVAARIREQVSSRVTELTGRSVREVNITVAELVPARRPTRSVR